MIESINNRFGISPVIGVILMVAITVVLSAVVGFFVLGVAENPPSTGFAGVDTEYSENQYEVTVRLTDMGTADSVIVEDTNGETTISVGETVTAEGEYTIYSVKDGNRSVLEEGGLPAPEDNNNNNSSEPELRLVETYPTTISTQTQFEAYNKNPSADIVNGEVITKRDDSEDLFKGYLFQVNTNSDTELIKVEQNVTSLYQPNISSNGTPTGYTYVYTSNGYAEEATMTVRETGNVTLEDDYGYTYHKMPADKVNLRMIAPNGVDNEYAFDSITINKYEYTTLAEFATELEFKDSQTDPSVYTVENDELILNEGDSYSSSLFDAGNGEQYRITISGYNVDEFNDDNDGYTDNASLRDNSNGESGEIEPSVNKIMSSSRSELVIKSRPNTQAFDGSDIELILDNPSTDRITIESINIETVEEVNGDNTNNQDSLVEDNQLINSTTTISSTTDFEEYAVGISNATINNNQVSVTNPSDEMSESYRLALDQPETGDLYKINYDITDTTNTTLSTHQIYDIEGSNTRETILLPLNTDDGIQSPTSDISGYHNVDDPEILVHTPDRETADEDASYTINKIEVIESEYTNIINYSNSTEFNNGTTNGTVNTDSVELNSNESYNTEEFAKNDDQYIVTVTGSNLDAIANDPQSGVAFNNGSGQSYSSGYEVNSSNELKFNRTITADETELSLDITNNTSQSVTIDSIQVETIDPVE